MESEIYLITVYFEGYKLRTSSEEVIGYIENENNLMNWAKKHKIIINTENKRILLYKKDECIGFVSKVKLIS